MVASRMVSEPPAVAGGPSVLSNEPARYRRRF